MITRQDHPYEWVSGAARYRDSTTKRFVKGTVVEAWSDDSISATKDIATELSEGANDNPQLWFQSMRSEIKNEYTRQYLTGAGGRNNMTQADWGSVGGMVADQYRYLNDMLAEIEAGNLSDLQIAARARMYINSAKEAFYRSSEGRHKVAEYSEKFWKLGATENHCADCPGFEGLGWVDIDFKYKVGRKVAYPGNGATECLTNCDCKLQFRK